MIYFICINKENPQQTWSSCWPRHWSCLCDGRLRWWWPDSPAGGETQAPQLSAKSPPNYLKTYIYIYIIYLWSFMIYDHLCLKITWYYCWNPLLQPSCCLFNSRYFMSLMSPYNIYSPKLKMCSMCSVALAPGSTRSSRLCDRPCGELPAEHWGELIGGVGRSGKQCDTSSTWTNEWTLGCVMVMFTYDLLHGCRTEWVTMVWEKRSENSHFATGQNVATEYMGDHWSSQVVLCKKLSFCSVPFEICNEVSQYVIIS